MFTSQRPITAITGCTLHNEDTGECWHGDLHWFNGKWIFNGATGKDAADSERLLKAGEKALVFNSHGERFDRRGVWVFDSKLPNNGLNDAAKEFLYRTDPRCSECNEFTDYAREA